MSEEYTANNKVDASTSIGIKIYYLTERTHQLMSIRAQCFLSMAKPLNGMEKNYLAHKIILIIFFKAL